MKQKALEHVREFAKLGFTKQEARVYLGIYEMGPLSVNDLAKHLKTLPNSLYRILEKLVDNKLITLTNTWPKIYKAIPPALAFDLLIKEKIIDFEKNKEKLISLLPPLSIKDQTSIEIIGGAKELFNAYVKLSRKAKREILIISIGEEVPEKVLLANRDTLERGVIIRFIAHKLDQSNKHLLIRWKRMGLKVRHIPGQGFHLVIFDKNQSLLSTSNPKNPKERATIRISSPALSEALGEYFNNV